MKKKLKLLLLGDTSVIHTRQWIEAFMGTYDIHVISATKGEENVNVKYYYINNYMKYGKVGYLLSVFFIRKIIRDVDPHLIHAHHVSSYGLISILTRQSRPLMITAHGSDILIFPYKHYFNKLLTKYVLKKADLVNSVATHMTNKLLELGINKNKILTLQYGVDTDCFFPINKKYQNKKPVFISTRQFKSIYNHKFLIDIAHNLKLQGIEFEFWLVGEGPTLNDIQRQVKLYNLTEDVKFYGNVDQVLLNKLLNQADFYISVSYSDGMSLCLLESFATKLFPIVSNIPANYEFIENNSTGILLNISDLEASILSIKSAIENKDFRDSFQLEKNYELIMKNFNREKNFKIMNQYYIKLIQEVK